MREPIVTSDVIAYADSRNGETVYAVCAPVRGGFVFEVETLDSLQDLQDIYGDVPVFPGMSG